MKHTILAIEVPVGRIICERVVIGQCDVATAKATIYKDGYLDGSFWANGRNVRLMTPRQFTAWQTRKAVK